MSGHNKWSKVKHKKGAADAAKSKTWTKNIREITVAAKLGGIDPDSNARLRKALDDARAANITKDTILRALQRASGPSEGADFEDLTYEGYGPGGVAVLIQCLTDNRNRTSGEIRSAFNKSNGNMGATGSVSFGFKKKGRFYFEKSGKANVDQLMTIGLDAGLEDISEEDEVIIVTCEPDDFMPLKDAFTAAGFVADSSEIEMVPDAYIAISGDQAKSFLKLVDLLEELDDVQKVWSNEDIAEEEMQRLMS